jgi:hypothetical protein
VNFPATAITGITETLGSRKSTKTGTLEKNTEKNPDPENTETFPKPKISRDFLNF